MIEYNTLSLAVEGYPGRQSYRPGEEVTLPLLVAVQAPSPSRSRASARRARWCGGRPAIAGREQPVPADGLCDGAAAGR